MGLLTRKDCWKFDQSWDFKRRNWSRREMGHRPRTRGPASTEEHASCFAGSWDGHRGVRAEFRGGSGVG